MTKSEKRNYDKFNVAVAKQARGKIRTDYSYAKKDRT